METIQRGSRREIRLGPVPALAPSHRAQFIAVTTLLTRCVDIRGLLPTPCVRASKTPAICPTSLMRCQLSASSQAWKLPLLDHPLAIKQGHLAVSASVFPISCSGFCYFRPPDFASAFCVSVRRAESGLYSRRNCTSLLSGPDGRLFRVSRQMLPAPSIFRSPCPIS
jgi:hypothetical protein